VGTRSVGGAALESARSPAPDHPAIERIAPVLGRTINEMIDAAYQDRLLCDQRNGAPHPVAHEKLSRILAYELPLSVGTGRPLVPWLERRGSATGGREPAAGLTTR